MEFLLQLSNIYKHQQDDKDLRNTLSRKIKMGDFELYTKDGAIIIPRSLQQDILQLYHTLLLHPGSTRMIGSMKKITWPTLQNYVEKFVKNCNVCSKNNLTHQKYGKLSISNTQAPPWESVAVELIGPYGNSKELNKNRYALTMIDVGTRWVELAPLNVKECENVVLEFDRWWLCRYPRPNNCIYNQGKEFVGQEFQELLTSYGIKSTPTTTRNPQANGIVERIHSMS